MAERMSEFLSEAEVAELERLHADAASAWNRGFVSSFSGARFADVVLGGSVLPRLLAERRALLFVLLFAIFHEDSNAE